MAYTHPFDISLENYLLSDARRKIVVEGNLGIVGLIRNLGTNDFKINLECSNLMIQGRAEQIISEDEEIILNYDDPREPIRYSRIVMLTHEADHVQIVYREASVKLHRLRGNLSGIISLYINEQVVFIPRRNQVIKTNILRPVDFLI